MPALGFSLLLLAAGLVLAVAVGVTVGGVSMLVVGLILAAVGGFGVILALLHLTGVMATEQAHLEERHEHHADHR